MSTALLEIQDQSRTNMSNDKLRFFSDYDDVNSDPSELAEREQELGITSEDWVVWRSSKVEVLF